MKKRTLLSVLLILLVAAPLWAKIPQDVQALIEGTFVAAAPHAGLLSSQEPLQKRYIRGYVTLVQGGIPAAKADWFITNQDYEYRASIMDVQSGAIRSRRGGAYTYLDAGTVLLIAAVEYSGNTVYLKLLTPDVYDPPGRHEKHPSRVSSMVGFKFPKAMAGDADAMLAELTQRVRPFNDRTSAEAFAATLSATPSQ